MTIKCFYGMYILPFKTPSVQGETAWAWIKACYSVHKKIECLSVVRVCMPCTTTMYILLPLNNLLVNNFSINIKDYYRINRLTVQSINELRSKLGKQKNNFKVRIKDC